MIIKFQMSQTAGAVEYINWISAEEKDSPNECTDMTPNNLMVRLL